MPIAIVLILLVIGSLIFHFTSPWWFTPIASNWGEIDFTVFVTFVVTGFVFVAVVLFLAYVIIRYRHKEGVKAHYEPENKKLEWWLTGFTTVGIVAMLAPGLVVWDKFVTVPDDAHEIEVIGQQWYWSYRFPGEDGVLGSVDSRYVAIDNPFGMTPDDPEGQDDVLIYGKDVHLPIDKPVKTLLRARDVLHDFAVPQFRVKMDLVPGMVTFLWFTPTRVGEFEIMCEEYCGLAHHTMRGRVIVDEQEDFEAWLAAQPTWAELKIEKEINLAAGQAAYAVCAACHGANGEGNVALNAPKTAGQDDWYMARQLRYYKEGVRGVHDDDVFGKQMAPMVATLPNDEAIRNVVAYINTLPDPPAPATIDGDARRGEKLFASCGGCHGVDGQGIWASNAPRLAGISDWYLITQIKNYKEGVRGAHRKDDFGQQMMLMADMLKSEEDIHDVVAYINELGSAQKMSEGVAAQ